jgi:hypothetical protein
MAKLSNACQVIHTQILKFHEAFRAAKSLEDMIQLHDEQCMFNPFQTYFPF